MTSIHRIARSLTVALVTLVGATNVAHAQKAAGRAQAAQPTLRVVAENRTAAVAAARGSRRADSTVHAGDVVRYKLTFTNSADRAIRNVAIQNPVPAGLQFVAGSAKVSRNDARAEYSLDGGRTWSARPMETVTIDGRQVDRPVSPERYTAVRWMVGGAVAPAATVTAEFEARLVLMPTRTASSSTAPSTPDAR